MFNNLQSQINYATAINFNNYDNITLFYKNNSNSFLIYILFSISLTSSSVNLIYFEITNLIIVDIIKFKIIKINIEKEFNSNKRTYVKNAKKLDFFLRK